MSLQDQKLEPCGVQCATKTASKPIVGHCHGDGFGYLTIGSPVPSAEVVPETADNNSDIDRDFPDGATRRKCHNTKAFFGSDFKGQQHLASSPDISDNKSNAPDNPTIKVEACRTLARASDHGSSLENVSTAGAYASYDCPSMHTSLHGGQQLFLNPTPPLGRRSVVNSRTVIYYSPSMTCSKSESSLIETTTDGPCGVGGVPEYDSGLVPAHSMSVLRSPSKAEVSVASRNVLLSPISFRKDRQSVTNLSSDVADGGGVRCTCDKTGAATGVCSK